MVQQVAAPDGRILGFPDDMTQEQILAVMREKFPPEPEPIINRFSQGAISQLGSFANFSGFGDFGRDLAETSLLPEGEPIPRSDILGKLEDAGVTQPGALERTDLPSTLGRAMASGLLFGGIGGIRGLGAEAVAAGTSALGEVGGRLVGGDTGGLVGSVLGGLAPSGLSSIARRSTQNQIQDLGLQSIDEMVAAGKEIGLPVTLADVSPGARALQGTLQRVPLTGARSRAGARLAEAGGAAKRLLDESLSLLNRTGWEDLSTVRRVAAGRGKRASEAQSILKAIDEAGDDLDTIIGVSGKLNVFRSKLQADKLYNRVSALAGSARVPASNTLRAIQDQVRRLNVGAEADQAAIRYLGGLFNKIRAKGPMTMEEIRATRSMVLHQARRLQGSNAVTAQGKRAIGDVAESMWDDLIPAAQASGSPRAVTELRKANKFYRNVYLPMRDSSLAKALNKTDLGDAGSVASRELDEIANQFLSKKRGFRAARTYDLLDKRGKAAIRARIYSQAFDSATLRADAGNAVFSPAKFASALEDWGPFLSKVSNSEVRGLAKVFRAVARGGGPGSTLETGARGADLQAIGGTIVMPAVAGVVSGSGAVAAAGGGLLIGGSRGIQAILESKGAAELLAQAARETDPQRLIRIGTRLTAIAARNQGEDEK